MKCLTAAPELLSGIVTMWVEIHTQLSGHEPGQDVLSFIGPGSSGAAGRELTPLEVRRGLIPGVDGQEHQVDNANVTNAPSVVQVLSEWADSWRLHRRETPAVIPPRSTGKAIQHAAAYLERHTAWAAVSYDQFAEYLQALRFVHARLEQVTGHSNPLVRAEAECFRCGHDSLVREMSDGQACEHDPETFPAPPPQWGLDLHGRPKRLRTADQVRDEHALAVAEWVAAHGLCQQLGGFQDVWTCRSCGDTYDWKRYLLALSGRLQTSDVPGWGLPEQVAFVLGVNPKTVRGWADRMAVTTACVVGDKPRGRLRISWEDARGKAQRLKPRKSA